MDQRNNVEYRQTSNLLEDCTERRQVRTLQDYSACIPPIVFYVGGRLCQLFSQFFGINIGLLLDKRIIKFFFSFQSDNYIVTLICLNA